MICKELKNIHLFLPNISFILYCEMFVVSCLTFVKKFCQKGNRISHFILQFKQIESFCSHHDVELRKGLFSRTLKGMREDVDMATREILRIQNMAEQKKQETLTANLVQWYYIKVQKSLLLDYYLFSM